MEKSLLILSFLVLLGTLTSIPNTCAQMCRNQGSRMVFRAIVWSFNSSNELEDLTKMNDVWCVMICMIYKWFIHADCMDIDNQTSHAMRTLRKNLVLYRWGSSVLPGWSDYSVQSLSHVRLCDPMDCSTPGLPVHHQLPEYSNSCLLMVMPSNHLILCHPLLLPPSIFPSIGVFSNELALRIKWPKYWSFRYSISPFSEYLGFISFRMDWFDLLVVQRTLKSLLQHHNSEDQFFSAQPSWWSNSYICTWLQEKP